MKKCKYCNGTGKVNLDKTKLVTWWGLRSQTGGGQCPKCFGKGIK